MKSISYVFLVSAVVALFSCGSSTTVQQTSDSVAVTETLVDSTAYVLDLAKSSIVWEGSKPTGTHNGVVNFKSGQLNVAEGEITAGAFVADMNTIVSEDLEKDSEMYGKLVGHLKSPDFFDVASFPEGSFEISSVAKLEAPVVKDSLNLTHKITGNLTLKGITKSISFDAQVSVTDSLVSAKSQKIVIDRTEWGIKFKSKKFFAELKDKIINDEIVLSINLEATK